MYPVDQQQVDEELHQDSRLCLSCIAQSFVNKNDISKVIETVEGIITSKSWHARHTVLNYIQVFAFTNLFSICANQTATATLQRIIIDLLQDEQFEVYRMASITLSGLIRCGVIPLNESILDLGRELSSTKLKQKKRVSGGGPVLQDAVCSFRSLHRPGLDATVSHVLI